MEHGQKSNQDCDNKPPVQDPSVKSCTAREMTPFEQAIKSAVESKSMERRRNESDLRIASEIILKNGDYLGWEERERLKELLVKLYLEVTKQ